MNTDTIGNYNMKQGNCPRIWPEGRWGGGMSEEQKNHTTVHSQTGCVILKMRPQTLPIDKEHAGRECRAED